VVGGLAERSSIAPPYEYRLKPRCTRFTIDALVFVVIYLCALAVGSGRPSRSPTCFWLIRSNSGGKSAAISFGSQRCLRDDAESGCYAHTIVHGRTLYISSLYYANDPQAVRVGDEVARIAAGDLLPEAPHIFLTCIHIVERDEPSRPDERPVCFEIVVDRLPGM
jgi:hypothetical protein